MNVGSRVRVQPAEEGVESEPEDENPEREIEDIAGLEEPLDSEDEASQTDELTDFETALFSGMRVAPPPSLTQLEFKK